MRKISACGQAILAVTANRVAGIYGMNFNDHDHRRSHWRFGYPTVLHPSSPSPASPSGQNRRFRQIGWL